MASRSSLPPYAHSSVPVCWLTFDRAGLSGLHAPALLGALISFTLSFRDGRLGATTLPTRFTGYHKNIGERCSPRERLVIIGDGRSCRQTGHGDGMSAMPFLDYLNAVDKLLETWLRKNGFSPRAEMERVTFILDNTESRRLTVPEIASCFTDDRRRGVCGRACVRVRLWCGTTSCLGGGPPLGGSHPVAGRGGRDGEAPTASRGDAAWSR